MTERPLRGSIQPIDDIGFTAEAGGHDIRIPTILIIIRVGICGIHQCIPAGWFNILGENDRHIVHLLIIRKGICEIERARWKQSRRHFEDR